jgi:hypothetical protein
VTGFSVSPDAEISVENASKYDDLSGRTFNTRSDVYQTRRAYGRLLNIRDAGFICAVANIADNRVRTNAALFRLCPAPIAGSGTAAIPS